MAFSFSHTIGALTPQAGPSVVDPDGFGVDYSTFAGDGTVRLDLHFRPMTGPRVVAQRVARGWLIPRKKLFWDESVGDNLPAMHNHDWTPDNLRAWKIALENGAKKEDGCIDCRVTLTASAATRTLTVDGIVYTKAGSFPLTVVAGDAISILFPEAA